jgi:hypothetical protein
MRVIKSILFPYLATLVVAGVRTHSQANVTENQTLSIYVDALNGSDGASGAAQAPLKTIQAAVNKANAENVKSIGAKVIVNPGFYHEAVSISKISGQTAVPLTLEAAAPGTAIIAGSETLTGWTADSPNDSIYTTTWTPNLGQCAIPAGWPTNFNAIALRREVVLFNGMPLTQVMSYADLRPGTFNVWEAGNVIHVWPPTPTDMQTADVEAAVRPQTLSVSGRTNVVLRGLVLTLAANCINSSSSAITSSSNVLVDSVYAVWNNWGGLGVFSSSNVTVQKSTASFNGGVGIQGNKIQNVLFDTNESDYNNWRGAQAAFYEWAMGGLKVFDSRNITVRNHFSYDNQGEGLWFDTDNQNVTIDRATLVRNVTAALQIERNEGPVLVENSFLCCSGVGLNVLTSEGLTVENSTFYNNGGTNKYQAEIFIGGQTGGITITNWLTKGTYDLFTTGMVMTGNTFQDAASGQNVFGTYLSGSDWSDFADSLNASNNRWYSPVTTADFKIEDGKEVTLAGWQSATGTDYTSVWEPAPASQFAGSFIPAPLWTDFSMNLNGRNFTMSGGVAEATVRVNSFGFGPVALSATGLPAGVSASFSNAEMMTSGVSTLTLSAGKTAAKQTVPITLWAEGSGRVHSVTIGVTVVPAA